MSCGLCDGADVEGVAAAGVPHSVEQRVVGRFAQHQRQQLTYVLVGQRPDLYSSRESCQLGEIGPTRLVGGTQRGDHKQRAAHRRGGDVGEGLQRRRVSPLQVVDDHQSRGCPRRRRHSDRELVENHETVRRDGRVAWRGGPRPGPDEREYVRQHARGTAVVGLHRSEHLHPGPEGGCHAALPASSPVHADAGGLGRSGQLRRQARLADAGRSGDDERPTGTSLGSLERRRQVAELPLSAHEALRGHPRIVPPLLRSRPYGGTAEPYAYLTGPVRRRQ